MPSGFLRHWDRIFVEVQGWAYLLRNYFSEFAVVSVIK